ncbi:hypothetical protein N7510_001605 [Penicillium lagena]|uniref:uncharacterized protein n=1 Tax=Penicillium lagena TaxID=94218 RepID=UPI002540401F|nr:uncharacterized protein N7510_001605 [Penicillium lagena]KAJ5625296.1 hypothetical protein N7510_001605 [Penicillium lagena]
MSDSNPVSNPPPYTKKDKKDKKGKKPLPDPGLSWGITPSEEHKTAEKPGPDHPVHKIPLEKQEEMRRKGINPILKAEMDEGTKGEGGFWRKVAGTALGGGWIK